MDTEEKKDTLTPFLQQKQSKIDMDKILEHIRKDPIFEPLFKEAKEKERIRELKKKQKEQIKTLEGRIAEKPSLLEKKEKALKAYRAKQKEVENTILAPLWQEYIKYGQEINNIDQNDKKELDRLAGRHEAYSGELYKNYDKKLKPLLKEIWTIWNNRDNIKPKIIKEIYHNADPETREPAWVEVIHNTEQINEIKERVNTLKFEIEELRAEVEVPQTRIDELRGRLAQLKEDIVSASQVSGSFMSNAGSDAQFGMPPNLK